MKHDSVPAKPGRNGRHPRALLPALAVGLAFAGAPGAIQDGARSIDEMRLTMGKMIETEQIISKERNDWAQGKEILLGRLELVRAEIGSLQDKIRQAETSIAEADAKRAELVAESGRLEAVDAQLKEAVTRMESEIRRLLVSVPESMLAKLDLLVQRMPADPTSTKASAAERFQNVLVILDALNKLNTELTVTYEVRELAQGRPAEVRVIYVGLAQAYYVSASGEAGIGRPTPEGWKWEPSSAIGSDVLTALEIIQGKHTPAFVPLPVNLR